jgi:hypothetical protein
MYYKLKRHVVFLPRTAESEEVWGIDRAPMSLETTRQTYTDTDDPLGCRCSLLLVHEGQYVTWSRFFEWLSYAETQGYSLVTPITGDLSPYSTLVIKGP